MMQVVVAEDSLLLRAGVVRVLEAAGFTVVGEASNADELLAQVRELRPDVVITDIRMPPTNTDEGLRAAATIRAELPGIGVLVLSQFARHDYAVQLLGDDAAGVGYLLKQRVTEPASFTEAVRRVARGGSALDPEVVAHILERRRPGGPIDSLTEREREVLARMAEGQSNRRIASELNLSDATMERVQGRIFEKLELPVDVEGHRRVLAVLTYLRALQD
jgi:DNA-binding NarL/FixJ family response regulator